MSKAKHRTDTCTFYQQSITCNVYTAKKVSLIGYNIIALRDPEREGWSDSPFVRKSCQYRVEITHFDNGIHFENQNDTGKSPF
jgi:hypothetical protein